jgi:ABC-type phosphate transport system permease subunit
MITFFLLNLIPSIIIGMIGYVVVGAIIGFNKMPANAGKACIVLSFIFLKLIGL